MSRGRVAVALMLLAFVGFWVLRGFFGGPDASPSEPNEGPTQGSPTVEEIEAEEIVVELVEPRGLGGIASPTGLLRSMYPSLWGAEGFCWEEATSLLDGANKRVATGLRDGDEPPPDLLALFEGRRRGYDDYEHRSFNSNRVLFLDQQMTVTASGREGPRASAVRIIRLERPDGRQGWTDDESAAIYLCDY